jgi:hypothetical protein
MNGGQGVGQWINTGYITRPIRSVQSDGEASRSTGVSNEASLEANGTQYKRSIGMIIGPFASRGSDLCEITDE